MHCHIVMLAVRNYKVYIDYWYNIQGKKTSLLAWKLWDCKENGVGGNCMWGEDCLWDRAAVYALVIAKLWPHWGNARSWTFGLCTYLYMWYLLVKKENVMGPMLWHGIPYGHHSSCLLVCLGKQWKMARMLGLLPSMWEIQMVFLPPAATWPIPGCCSQLRNE